MLYPGLSRLYHGKSGRAKVDPMNVADAKLAILMFESALLTTPEAKGALGFLLNNPAFFPFQLPVITGDFVSQRSSRIEVVRYGLDDELLKLKPFQYASLRACMI